MAQGDLMSSEEVAEFLGYKDASRVRQLALSGELPGQRVADIWVFNRDDVVAFAGRRRRPGRPKKRRADPEDGA